MAARLAPLSRLRTTLHAAISTTSGDAFAAVRVPKGLARRANAFLGRPLCSSDELTAREAAQARLLALRSEGGRSSLPREQAPVTVYFEKDRNARMLERICELLDAKSIRYKKLDVAGDEATLQFATRKAGCEPDDLPIVFVGTEAVGTYADLVKADVAGSLARALAGMS